LTVLGAQPGRRPRYRLGTGRRVGRTPWEGPAECSTAAPDELDSVFPGW